MSLDRMLLRDGWKKEACRHSRDAPAFLARELSDSERQAFETHLAGCPVCARELENVRHTLGMLETLGPATITHDLAPEILARVDSGRAEACRTSALRYVYAAAAALLLLLGGAIGFWALHRESPTGNAPTGIALADQGTASARSEALAWICRTQAPDGSWNAEEWGGDKQFGVALSSLAVLAVLGSEPVSQERAATVRKAVAYLVRQQSATGEFGPSFSSTPYNQGIATLALLRAFQVLHDDSMRPPLNRAVAVICRRQVPEGGWGYWGQATPEPNLSVTLWQIEALKLAVRLGWDEARPSVQRAVQWVMSVADDRGFFGYRRAGDFSDGTQTLSAMGALAVLDAHDKAIPPGRREVLRAKVREAATSSSGALDYYRAYFLTEALREMPDKVSQGQCAVIRGSVVSNQVAIGAEKGSWSPDDRWGGVGGRVYATAMASLSLE